MRRALALTAAALTGLVCLVVLAGPGSAATLKPPPQGLIDRGVGETMSPTQAPYQMPPSPYSSFINGIVVEVHWSDLQTTAGGAITSNNAVDKAIAAVNSFNAAHPTTPDYLIIRMRAGVWAPNWAKTLGGFKPVTITNPDGAANGTVGPFWTPAYYSAYTDFMNKMAAKYDANPLIRGVTASMCMTYYAEPFNREPAGAAGLLNQGYTIAKDHTCELNQMDAQQAWQQTRTIPAFNVYKGLVKNSSGAVVLGPPDEAFTASAMDHCRAVLGQRCVLGNNSIRIAFQTQQPQAQLYPDIKKRCAPIEFQTAVASRIGDMSDTINWAIQLGANGVEVEQDFATQTDMTVSALQTADQQLQANPTDTCK